MHDKWHLLLLATAMMLLSAPLLPLSVSKSSNPCASCHGDGRYMYLDILEGDAGNTIPTAIIDNEVLQVAVVIEVTGSTSRHNVMTGITATLASQNGLFSVDVATFDVGALVAGQRATAFWNVSAVSSGSDVMLITSAGHNTHKGREFQDGYSPSPAITVSAASPDLPPAIALTAPAAGQQVTGGTDLPVAWTVTDEERATCLVSLYYSTDGFAASNETIATALPATKGHTWTTPMMDSDTVTLKATVTDKAGHFNQTVLGWAFAIDSTAPSVASVLPSDGETGVSTAAALQVRFSEPVEESSAEAAFSISPDPGGVVTWTWDAYKTTMTATHGGFDAGTTYNCTVSAGIRDRSSPGNTCQGTFIWSFNTSKATVPEPSIALTSPAGGERLYWGAPLEVRWAASGGTGTLLVNLSLSQNGAAGPFTPVATAMANSGQHAMTAPAMVSDHCVLRATVFDQAGLEGTWYSGEFMIARPLNLSADLPAEGVRLQAGAQTTLNWTGTGGHGTVTVMVCFRPDPGSPEQPVLMGQPLTGNCTWTVPAVDAVAAMLCVNATDDWGRSVEVSSGTFSITTNHAPRFSGTAPIAGHTGVPYEYWARAEDDDGDRLTYSIDKGPSGMTIDAATGKLAWTPSSAGDSSVKIKVSDGRGGEAVQEFTIHVIAKVAPHLIITAPAEGKSVRGKVMFTGTVTKGSLGIEAVQYRVDSGEWMNATVALGWQFTVDTTRLKDGTHTIEVRAFDGAGYSDTASRTIKVENGSSGAGGFIPAVDAWVALALVGMVGAFLRFRRK
ncbi:MAG: hypothetical protein FJ149_10910 [Euryarchaeota archaeon]|nr:hypothetical protein [Euryarchaeota archaeon]